MAKFNLKSAIPAANTNSTFSVMAAGYHRVTITQMAEVGLQPGFGSQAEPKESVGFVFENAAGQQITKIMTAVVSSQSNLYKVAAAVDDVDELPDFLGKQLVIEVESNGNYPKIVGYYHLDEGLSSEPEITSTSELLFYSVEEPKPEILKLLHPQLKQAIAGRIRHKAGV